MKVLWYATLRPIVGQRESEVPAERGATVGTVLRLAVAQHQGLAAELFADQAQTELKPYVNVFVNGRSVHFLQGLDTALNVDDEVAVFPPVAGGTQLEMELRGFGLGQLAYYLSLMEGRPGPGPGRFAGPGWELQVTEGRDRFGSLSVQTLQITWHGEESTVAAAAERLRQVSMRAGG